MRKTLGEIASLVSGQTCGNATLEVKGVSPLEEASEGDLAFVLDLKNEKKAKISKASAFVVSCGREIPKKPCIVVKNPRLALIKILELFAPEIKKPRGIHETFVSGENVKIGSNVNIGPYVSVGDNVSLGDNVTIYPGVTIYDRTKIGKNVIIHAGSVIGVDGFGFLPADEGNLKIPQIGHVVIEDDVEIYANTCVSRATMGKTIIRRGTKIDNSSHIAHNCDIGEDCLITGHVAFAGSVTIGKKAIVGGQAGFVDHTRIGDNCIVTAKTGVSKDFPDNSVISGFPSRNHKEWLKINALSAKLPEVFERLEKLEKTSKPLPLKKLDKKPKK